MVAIQLPSASDAKQGVEAYQAAAQAWAERGRLIWLVGAGVAEVLAEIGSDHTQPGDGKGLVGRLEALVERAGAMESAQRVPERAAPIERLVGRDGERQRDRIWQGQERRLDDRRYLVLFLGSGATRGGRATLAVGVDEQGAKHVLGVWEHTTANAAVGRALVAELAGRGLSADQGLLAVVPGHAALEEALRRTWGSRVQVAHCQSWVRHGVLAHLPERARPAVAARLRGAWSMPEPQAMQGLSAVAEEMEREHPGAAARLRASQSATLVVAGLELPDRLRHHLEISGPARMAIEGAVAATAPGKRGLAAVRAGLPAVVGRMRRLIGYEALPQLAEKLRLHVAGAGR